MSILDTYGIQEVCDVTFYKIDEDGNPTVPALYLDTLKISTLEQAAENAQAVGGKGNAPLIQWDFGKEITFNVQDALFSMKSLATMYGGDAITPAESTMTFIVRPVQSNLSAEEMDLLTLVIHIYDQEIRIKPSDLVKPGTQPGTFEENPDVPVFQFPWDSILQTADYSIVSTSSTQPIRVYMEVTPPGPSTTPVTGFSVVPQSNTPSTVFTPNTIFTIYVPWDNSPTPDYNSVSFLKTPSFIMKTEVFTPVSNITDYTSLKEAGWSEYYIENGKKTLKINPKIYAADGSVKTTYTANEPVLISYDIVGYNKNEVPDNYCNFVLFYNGEPISNGSPLMLDFVYYGTSSTTKKLSYILYLYPDGWEHSGTGLQNGYVLKVPAITTGAIVATWGGSSAETFQVFYQLASDSLVKEKKVVFEDLRELSDSVRTQVLYQSSSGSQRVMNNKNIALVFGPSIEPETSTIEWPFSDYEYFDYDSGTTSIDIKADTFPGTYYVVGDTLARGSENGEDEMFQIVIPKAKIMVDNTLTLEAGGDPSVFDFNMRVLKPGKGQPMVRLVKYDVNGEDVEKNVTLVHNHILEDKIEIEPLKLLSLTIENDTDPSSPHSIEPRFSPDNLNYTITGGSGSTSFDLVAVANENVTIIFYQEGIEKASGLGTVTHTIFDDGGKGEWTIVLDSSGETTTYIVEFV